MKTVKEIQVELLKLGEKINAPKEYLVIGSQLSDIVVNLEIHGDMYLYSVLERGVEKENKLIESESDVLYVFMEKASHSVASSYAAMNKIPGKSFREIMFEHQLELLHEMNPKWARKRKIEIDNILQKYPSENPES